MSRSTTSEHPGAPSVAQSPRALRWTVVGAGSIGRRHLRNLRALGVESVTAVRRSADALSDDLSAVQVSTRLVPSADDRAVAVVCTPTASHASDAIAALDAGYHVLIEKPIAATVAGAAAIQDAAARRGRLVMVASCLRFHPVLQALRRVVSSGAVGDIHWVAVWCGQHLSDWRPARAVRDVYSARRDEGGGVLLDLIHEIDYLQWIWGDVRLVSARIGNGARLGIDAEETADLLLTLPNDATGTCHLDYLARPATRGGRLAGARGSARWDLVAPSFELWTEPVGRWQSTPLPAEWVPDQMYRDELLAFTDTILGRATNLSPADEGERALALALQARAAGEAVRE